MTTGNLATGVVFGLLLLLPPGFARAEPPLIAPQAPLSVPTPEAPKLRLPQIAPPPASMMLDQIRPLRVPRTAERPTLNRFPSTELGAESDEEAPNDLDDEPRIRLDH